MFTKLLSFINSIRRPESKEQNDVGTPENHEQPQEQKNSYSDGVVHMFRATVGTGILGLPAAFSRAGYIGGTIGVAFVVFIANYCAVILVRSQREQARRNEEMVPTFQGTVQAAFAGGPKRLRSLGPFFMTCTNVSILTGQLGGLCVSIVFIASNMKAALFPHFDVDLRYYELMVFFVVAAASLIPNLKKLAIVSSFGNVILLISVAVIFYYDLRDPISLEGKSAFGDLTQYPLFIGMVFYASITIAIVLPLQAEMERPDMFEGTCGVLNTTGYMYGILYIFFGLLGYLRYGDSAAGSITLNLPSGDILSRAVQILLALSTLTSATLLNYVSVSIIWNDYLAKMLTKNCTLAQYVLRISIVSFTFMIAVLVPNLKLLISVLGVIVQCTVNTTLPCIVNILTHYKQTSFWAYVRIFWLDAIALLVTVLVLVYGLTSSLMKAP